MKPYITLLIKGLIVIFSTAAIVFGANAAMDRFLESELEAVMAMSGAAEELQNTQIDKDDKEAEYKLKLLKLEQQELFYQKYSNRESYHYYGQYYELYNNVYDADVWFIGTSHASHGLNPYYVEEACPEHSFFNFALNGSNPAFYEDWWEIVLESGYPMPKVIIWCVDWFMCDDGWLWRRIDFDTAPNMPIDIMRRMRKTQPAVKTTEAETEADKSVETVQPSEESTPADTAGSDKSGEKKINWWSVDEVTGEIFSRLSIISSRDRIPDMVRSWFSKPADKPADDAITQPTETDEDDEEFVLPTYTHEYKRDNLGNITSDYYKGFIPWDVPFGGDSSTISCNDKESQWRAFERMLDTFADAGIKVAFIEMPEYTGVKRLKMDQNNERIAEIAKRRGIEFYDYNTGDVTGIGSDVSNYSDWGHMNKKGSTLFSKLLGSEMKKILGEQ